MCCVQLTHLRALTALEVSSNGGDDDLVAVAADDSLLVTICQTVRGGLEDGVHLQSCGAAAHLKSRLLVAPGQVGC